MKISAIRSIEDNYKIKLSTKVKKNLNFIICEPEEQLQYCGRIWSYFAREKTLIEIDIQDETRFVPKFMFVDEDMDYRDFLNYFVDMKYTEDFEEIVIDVNHIGKKLLDYYSEWNGDLLKFDGYDILVPKYLEPDEAVVAYYALLIAIRRKYKINYPLIVERFGRWGLKYSALISQLISNNVPQALIFVTERNFASIQHFECNPVPVHKHITDFIGRAYKVVNGKMIKFPV